MDELQPQTPLREVIEANVEAAEAGTLQTQEESAAQRARDEAGRFTKKEPEAEAPAPKEAPAQEAPPPAAPEAAPAPARPSTWKKEYWPIYDKLAAGLPVDAAEAKKLTDYINQRENEYKTGVSTYKSEAMQAKDIQEAVAPFVPHLQANGLAPAQWIRNVGQTHYALHNGTPELKLQVFRELARQFNVPIGLITEQQGQVPPLVNDLLGQIQALKQQVQGVSNWRQQQEMTSLMGEINKISGDTHKYPHFEAVRPQMAQLLESGLAQDLHSAYEQACYLNPEVRELLLAEKAAPAVNPAAAVAKAKARAVSPKSATPSGAVTNSGSKDRRAALEEAFDASAGGRV